MKLHCDLVITQKISWLLMNKISETFDDEDHKPFGSYVEGDETNIGGKEKNKPKSMNLNAEHCIIGKTDVFGVMEQGTNKDSASSISNTALSSIIRKIENNVKPETTLYTDAASAYKGVKENHQTVNHLDSEFVKQQDHMKGVESFWALLNRGYYDTYHRMTEKHLGRYVNEFAGRHNIRSKDTIEKMMCIVQRMVGKQMTYKELVK